MTTKEHTWEGYPIFQNDRRNWFIATPLELHKYTADGPMLCGHQEGPEIQSNFDYSSARAMWVGHLKCFPDSTPLNQAAKAELLSEHSPDGFWASINHPDGAHMAALIIVIDEECGIPCFPNTNCCRSFEIYKKRGLAT